MKLFLLEPIGAISTTHEAAGFVVAAADYDDARKVASRNHRLEGRDFWFNETLVKCMVLSEDTWCTEGLVCEIRS